MRIRIVGTELPGCKHNGYLNVHLGLQVGNEVIERVSADVERAVFEMDVKLVDTADGIDFRGPCVHGKRGARFLYLSWGNVGADGSWQTSGEPSCNSMRSTASCSARPLSWGRSR